MDLIETLLKIKTDISNSDMTEDDMNTGYNIVDKYIDMEETERCELLGETYYNSITLPVDYVGYCFECNNKYYDNNFRTLMECTLCDNLTNNRKGAISYIKNIKALNVRNVDYGFTDENNQINIHFETSDQPSLIWLYYLYLGNVAFSFECSMGDDCNIFSMNYDHDKLTMSY